jgi:hypothetical protein
MGVVNNNLTGALIREIDPEFVVRAVRWFEKLVKIDNNLGVASFALIEIMQEVPSSSSIQSLKTWRTCSNLLKGAFNSSGAPDVTAWPHQARRHILQLATGTLPGVSPSNEVALKLLETAPSEIAQTHDACDYVPNFIESYNDLSKV